jgi:hypothetical protein
MQNYDSMTELPLGLLSACIGPQEVVKNLISKFRAATFGSAIRSLEMLRGIKWGIGGIVSIFSVGRGHPFLGERVDGKWLILYLFYYSFRPSSFHGVSCVVGLFRPSFIKVGREKGRARVKYVYLGLRYHLRYSRRQKGQPLNIVESTFCSIRI